MIFERNDWLDSYYEALEFFYWEPQHVIPKSNTNAELEAFARIAKQANRLDTVRKHLRKMEVTLNHNIRQFFILAPDAFRNSLFEKLFRRGFDDAFVLHGRGIDSEFALENCMQPDFLFVSEANVVSLR